MCRFSVKSSGKAPASGRIDVVAPVVVKLDRFDVDLQHLPGLAPFTATGPVQMCGPKTLHLRVNGGQRRWDDERRAGHQLGTA